jgi:metal-dependent hydrolase (beta-lactamase superfamily II)
VLRLLERWLLLQRMLLLQRLLLLLGCAQAGVAQAREVAAAGRPEQAVGGAWEHAERRAHLRRVGHPAKLPLHGRKLVCSTRAGVVVLHGCCHRCWVVQLVPAASSNV